MDPIRQRFLQDRVLTASPVQRVVMLYDRLLLDLARSESADGADADHHLDHAAEIVSELLGSLDHGAGDPAGELASLYGFMLRTLMTARLSGSADGIETVRTIATGLRETWAQVAAGSTQETVPPGASSWTA